MHKSRARARGRMLVALACMMASVHAHADPQVLEKARALIASGNAREAFAELSRLQGQLGGTPEFDYLLGVAALDSGRNDEAIIAFERVLALMPNHAGAQMDLARAYYASGSIDLAEAAFVKLRASNPPPAAQQAIARYLEAIHQRKRESQAGWLIHSELGTGYDSNITGVPVDFGAAAQQAFNLIGIEATGNSVKRSAPFVAGAFSAEYARPLGAGWTAFAGGDVRGRAYRRETDFNSATGEVHAGGALSAGRNQWRASASYLAFRQEGAAPGEPKPTNDRRMGGVSFDWRRAIDSKTQVGIGLQLNRVTFPQNEIEDFDQLFLSGSWLRSFDRQGAPLLYLTAFGSYDRAPNEFADGTTKSKALGGLRSYAQYSVTPKLQVFQGAAIVHRRDRDEFARSTEVPRGRDTYGELSLGAQWQFRDACQLRLQYAYSLNRSNIDIFDFNRHEISSTIRCELG
jgi:tetratricopeptide (TPR) repeat protein